MKLDVYDYDCELGCGVLKSLRKKIEAIKDVLKLPDCKSADETPDIVLGFEEQFYLKKILEASG
uniref:Uncharacterized protein n=1 Tax=viral metagenome TaxID=1070528 RepID=A0A6M3MIT3_9ZZZZ